MGFLNNGANFHEISEEKLSEIVLMANIAAAMSTEGKGAIPSIPKLVRVREAFKEINSK